MKLLGTVLLSLILSSCNVSPYDSRAEQQAAEKSENFQTHRHIINGQTLFSASTGNISKPAVLFIHGAPGDWTAWGSFLGNDALNKNAFLIAADRPGYGNSNKGVWEVSLKKQAHAIIEAARRSHPGPFIIVGHSFGGPVAIQAAIDSPEHVVSLIILAGSLDPDLEETKFIQYIADSVLFQWLVPAALDVANQEILPLQNELRKQTAQLKNIKKRITVIQGDDDDLVPPGNADYLEAQLTNSNVNIIRITNQGHFLPWEQHGLVKNTIQKHLEYAKKHTQK